MKKIYFIMSLLFLSFSYELVISSSDNEKIFDQYFEILKNNQEDRIESFIKTYGCSLTDDVDKTFLYYAVIGGYLDTVKALLAAGASIDKTLLCEAVRESNYLIVQELLKKIDTSSLSQISIDTFFHDAYYNSPNANMIKVLLDKGLKPQCRESNGRTLLHKSISGQRTNFIKLFIDYNINLETVDNNDISPLLLAVHFNDIDTVRLLCAKNIQIDRKNKFGDTALNVAQQNKSTLIVDLLKSQIESKTVQSKKIVTREMLWHAFTSAQDAKRSILPLQKELLKEHRDGCPQGQVIVSGNTSCQILKQEVLNNGKTNFDRMQDEMDKLKKGRIKNLRNFLYKDFFDEEFYQYMDQNKDLVNDLVGKNYSDSIGLILITKNKQNCFRHWLNLGPDCKRVTDSADTNPGSSILIKYLIKIFVSKDLWMFDINIFNQILSLNPELASLPDAKGLTPAHICAYYNPHLLIDLHQKRADLGLKAHEIIFDYRLVNVTPLELLETCHFPNFVESIKSRLGIVDTRPRDFVCTGVAYPENYFSKKLVFEDFFADAQKAMKTNQSLSSSGSYNNLTKEQEKLFKCVDCLDVGCLSCRKVTAELGLRPERKISIKQSGSIV